MRADADPRPDPEWQIGEAIRRRRARHEALWDECVRVAPEFFVPVQKPRRDQDHVILPDRQPRHDVGRNGRAGNQESRRIKPHGFIDHRAGEFQPLDIERAVGAGVVCFDCHLLLGDGIECQQIKRPEQRGGRRLVTGKDHRRHLVAELCVGESATRFRIARRAHQVEQVARRGAVMLAGGAAFRHQHGNEPRPPFAESRPRKILRARPG